MTERPTAWYLSFADDTGFLGGVYVWAHDCMDAVKKTHIMGINPGGEIKIIGIADILSSRIPESWFNRLLTRDELIGQILPEKGAGSDPVY